MLGFRVIKKLAEKLIHVFQRAEPFACPSLQVGEVYRLFCGYHTVNLAAFVWMKLNLTTEYLPVSGYVLQNDVIPDIGCFVLSRQSGAILLARDYRPCPARKISPKAI